MGKNTDNGSDHRLKIRPREQVECFQVEIEA